MPNGPSPDPAPKRAGGGGGCEGGPVVPRRERFPRSFGPAEKAPVRYRHEDFGNEKPGPKQRKKLGSGYGIGAVPRSPLPEGVDSVTVFCPELLSGGREADVRLLAAIGRLKDGMAAGGIKWWEDRRTDVSCAANLSREQAEELCLSSGVDSFLRFDFGPERDSFRSARYSLGREGFREGRVHRVGGVNPTEILEKAEATAGVSIPKIPPGIMKGNDGNGV